MDTDDSAEAPLPPSHEHLVALLQQGDSAALRGFFQKLDPGDTARSILDLDRGAQARLLTLLKPVEAAAVIRDVIEEQAADVIEELPPPAAAAIVDRLPSDEQADILAEMAPATAQAIIAKMQPAEAADATQLLQYGPDTAGGLMIKEYLAYREDQSIGDVLRDLQTSRDKYADHDVQYLYVTDPAGRLTGVMRTRDLLFSQAARPLHEIMLRNPLHVRVADTLDRLRTFFEDHHLLGAPTRSAWSESCSRRPSRRP